jgi:hypothetical protein
VIRLRKMTWVGHVAPMEETRNAYKYFVGTPEWFRCKWEDNIKTNFKETVYEDVNWFPLGQDMFQ